MRLAAFLLVSVATAGCVAIDSGIREVWPDYRATLRVTRDGRVDPEPLPETATRASGWDSLEVEYRDARGLVVREQVTRGDSGGWLRRIQIDGAASGVEVVVRVPFTDPAGNPLEVAVNGAPVRPGFGAVDLEVPLSRDEATRILLRAAARE